MKEIGKIKIQQKAAKRNKYKAGGQKDLWHI
jgi:hypothetical protein